MKDRKTKLTRWLFIIAALIGAGYTLTFFIYKDFEKSFIEEREFTISKFKELEDSLQGFSINFENTMDKSAIERGNLLSDIENIKKDFQDLTIDYKGTVAQLKDTIDDLEFDRLIRTVEKLQDDIQGVKIMVQDLDIKVDEYREQKTGLMLDKKDAKDIDLGKISVKKEQSSRHSR